MVAPLASNRPLMDSLAALADCYGTCVARAEMLVAALVAGDFSVVQAAVAAQTAAFRSAERAEVHRRQAEAALVRLLGGASRPTPGRLTISALAALLPEDEARKVRLRRAELLNLLVRLQALQQQCGVLARSALASSRRQAGQAGAGGYGPTGEQQRVTARAGLHAWRSG
jgi:hypothetical protein